MSTKSNSINPADIQYKPLIIYEWDGTLYPKSWDVYRPSKICRLSIKDREDLEALEAEVINLLRASLLHGKIIIINYVNEEHIKLICQRWFPNLWTFINIHHIKLLFCDVYLKNTSLATKDDRLRVRSRPLKKEIRNLSLNEPRLNILLVGDNLHANRVFFSLGKEFPVSLIKLVRAPDDKTTMGQENNNSNAGKIKIQLETLQKRLKSFIDIEMDFIIECEEGSKHSPVLFDIYRTVPSVKQFARMS